MTIHALILIASLIAPAERQQRDSVEAHFAHAVELFNEHDDTGEAMDEAGKEFALVLRLNPRYAPARAYQGLIALDKNDQVAAETAFRDALTIDPNCAEAHVGRVELFRKQARWKESYDEARLAVKLAPASILARWELITLLLNRAESPVTEAERKEAEPHLKMILESKPNERQAHLDLADMYSAQQRWSEAIPHYREVLRIGQTSEDSDVWVYEVNKTVAECYEKIHDYSHAVEYLNKYRDIQKEYGAPEDELREINARILDLQKKAAQKN
jgi:tetratricopeptide (TPR) repeat protein